MRPDHGRIEIGATPKGGLRSDARPRGKDLLYKNHEAASISWAGRAQRQNHVMGLNPRRGDPVDRPGARRILRKPVEASKERASPADAFCTEAPCPRATTQAFWKCQPLLDTGPPADPGVFLKEIINIGQAGLRGQGDGFGDGFPYPSPGIWGCWGSGWRNSDHQARRDHRFRITLPPVLRK